MIAETSGSADLIDFEFDLFRVQVRFTQYGREYTYLCDDPTVRVGDLVEVPPNSFKPHGTSKVPVIRLGSDYTGPCDLVLRVVRRYHDPHRGEDR